MTPTRTLDEELLTDRQRHRPASGLSSAKSRGWNVITDFLWQAHAMRSRHGCVERGA